MKYNSTIKIGGKISVMSVAEFGEGHETSRPGEHVHSVPFGIGRVVFLWHLQVVYCDYSERHSDSA